MRISDWSSDLCSSDLAARGRGDHHFERLGLLRDVGIPLRHMRHEACGKRLAERRMRHAERPADMVLEIGVELFAADARLEEHTSELQSLIGNSYAVFCLKKKNRLRHTLPN